MSYDHWKTGGDSPGITDAQHEDEARERYEEAQAEAEDAAAQAQRDEDGPPDAEHELRDTSQDDYHRAWDEKRSLR